MFFVMFEMLKIVIFKIDRIENIENGGQRGAVAGPQIEAQLPDGAIYARVANTVFFFNNKFVSDNPPTIIELTSPS